MFANDPLINWKKISILLTIIFNKLNSLILKKRNKKIINSIKLNQYFYKLKIVQLL
jgi:hypothetical protein